MASELLNRDRKYRKDKGDLFFCQENLPLPVCDVVWIKKKKEMQ